MLLIDTDVIVWYLRGNERARKAIESEKSFLISVVTYMELVQGMRNMHELRLLRGALRNWNAKVIYINEEISSKAMSYVERYFLSNSLELADALIAATAVVNGLDVLTGNMKHYRIVKELRLKVFKIR